MRNLPLPPDEIRDRFIWRVLRLSAFVAVPITLGYAVAYVVRGQWALAAVELAGGTLIAAAVWGAHRRRDPILGLQWMAVVMWCLLAAVIVLHGGLRSPSLLWMAMLSPLLFLAGAPLAIAVAVLSTAFVGGLYVAEVAGWLPPFGEVPLLQRAVSAVLLILLFVAFAHNAGAWRNGMADELAAARDAAIEAGRRKDRFIAILNHELRTPLNAMIGSAQLLARRSGDPEQQRLLDALQRSADHLLRLVNDVLDHARLEAGRTELEHIAFSLRTQLGNVVGMLGPLAEAKSLELRLDVEPTLADALVGDPTRLRQLAVNLVSNAIKFTSSGRVELRARAETASAAAPWLRLEVEDTGPGLSGVDRARLFEPFEQGDVSIRRTHGGTGLGLTICRELVRLMGGEIEAETGASGGALFVVRLPLALAPASPPAAPAAERARPRADLRVLVVEDDATNRLVVEALLTHLGVRVSLAEGGAQALAMLEHEPVDLVLMDLRMPGIDGLAACRLRREHERLHGLPPTRIVALTGEALDALRRDCVDAGMDGLLSKPVSLADLESTLAGAGTPAGLSPS